MDESDTFAFVVRIPLAKPLEVVNLLARTECAESRRHSVHFLGGDYACLVGDRVHEVDQGRVLGQGAHQASFLVRGDVTNHTIQQNSLFVQYTSGYVAFLFCRLVYDSE